MTTPVPGWLPDPSGRHEYRYWNGASWSDDVSDNGLTSADPVAAPLPPPGAPMPPAATSPGAPAPPPAGATAPLPPADGTAGPDGGAPTQPFDAAASGAPTAPHDPLTAPTESVGDPTAAYGATLPPAPPTAPYGTPSPGYGPPSGGYPPAGGPMPGKPGKSGPSTGLLVGLGVLAVALIAGIVFVLTQDDGDDTASDDTDTTALDEATDDSATDTTVDDGSDDTGDDLDLDDPGGFDAGDLDLEDPAIRDMLVSVMATELVESEGLTQEQAECFAGGILDSLGAEKLAEIGASGGDMSSLTPEDFSGVAEVINDCELTDEMGG